MKIKNDFKSSQAYIRILILCFGVFFSSNAFSFDCGVGWIWDPDNSYGFGSQQCLNFSTGEVVGIMTCSDGSQVWSYQGCPSEPPPEDPEFVCWDGSMSVGGTCPPQNTVICPDGSEHSAPYTCPINTSPSCSTLICADVPQQCTNADGSAGSIPACPLPYQCWDGSFAADAESCPWPDVLCDDGSTAPDFDSCPSGAGQVICKDGSLAPTQNDCPTDGDGGGGDGDGGTTTTTTSPDGTKTSVTTKPDGTKITTVTKPDGSSTTTTVLPDGTTTVTTTPATGIEWINCPDGSKALSYEMCFVRDTEPPTGGEFPCWDGSTSVDGTCPVQINCPNGTSIHEGETCPSTLPDYPACEDTPSFCTDSGKCTGSFGNVENAPFCDKFEEIVIDPDEPIDPEDPVDKPLDPVDTPTDDPEFDKPTDDPCANGACDGTQTEMPKDYARESTAQAIVNVNKSIGNLVEDIRFKELASMIAYLNDSTNSLESIKEYEKLNFDKFKELTKELGLQGLNDQQFYDLMTKKTDMSNRLLQDISNSIDWDKNNLSVSDQLKINELKKIKKAVDESTEQLENQTFLLSKLADSLSESSDNSDELIASLGDIKSTLDGAFKDDGSAVNLPSTDSDVGDLLGTSGTDLSDSIGEDLTGIRDAALNKMTDTNELDNLKNGSSSSVASITSFFTDAIPSPVCSASHAVNQTFTVGGVTRTFALDPCQRLAELKLALAYIFALYSGRTAFNNIFAPKGS